MKFGVKKEGGALIGGGAINGEFTVFTDKAFYHMIIIQVATVLASLRET